MPQITFNNEELDLLLSAISSAASSAIRAQKTGKSPQITQVFKLHEANLNELHAKLTKINNAIQK